MGSRDEWNCGFFACYPYLLAIWVVKKVEPGRLLDDYPKIACEQKRKPEKEFGPLSAKCLATKQKFLYIGGKFHH